MDLLKDTLPNWKVYLWPISPHTLSTETTSHHHITCSFYELRFLRPHVQTKQNRSVLVHVGGSTRVFIYCLWRPEGNPSCFWDIVHPALFCFLKNNFSMTWSTPVRLDWLESEIQVSVCPHLFVARHFMWTLRIELRVMLMGQTLYWLNFLCSMHNVLFCT